MKKLKVYKFIVNMKKIKINKKMTPSLDSVCRVRGVTTWPSLSSYAL